jgi:hypothetical protein
MPQPDEQQFLRAVFPDRPDVVGFLNLLFKTTQVIDDLVDKDRPVDDDTIFRSFWTCLFELPLNSLYRENEIYLRPILAAGFQDWWDSVKLERSGDHHGKTIAFVLRDSLTGVVIQCAYIVGGYDYMQTVSEKIRRHAYEETLDQYLEDLTGDQP